MPYTHYFKKASFLIAFFYFSINLIHANELRFEQLTNKSGIPSLSINQIFQDSNDYLWLTTTKGVAKYDGNSFEIFNTSTIPSVFNDFTFKIVESFDGSIWITTEGGITRILNGVSIHYFERSYISDISYVNNTIFILKSGELYLYDKDRDKFQKKNTIGIVNRFKSILKLNNDFLLLNSDNSQYLFNSVNGNIVKINNNNNIITHSIEHGDFLFLSIKNYGVIKINKKNVSEFFIDESNTILKSKNVVNVNILDSDNIIILNKNGSSVSFNISTKKIKYFKSFDESAVVSGSIVDSSSVLWVSTVKSGVFKYPTLKNGSSYQKIENNITSVFSINNDNYYSTKIKTTCFSEKCQGQIDIPSIWEVKSLDNINYYIAHKNGFSVFNTVDNKIKHLYKENSVYTFSFVNENEFLLISSSINGILKYNSNENSFSKILKKENDYENLNTFSIRSHYHGDTLYIATVSGLYSYNFKTEKEIVYPELRSFTISDIEINEKKGLWVSAQSKGLYFLDFSTGFLSNILSDGNSYSNIINIGKYLYLTTKNKITKFNFTTKSKYDFESLLVDLDFEFKNSSKTKTKNHVYFATNKGFITLKTDQIRSNLYNAKTKIKKILINEKEVSIKENMELESDDNNLSFYFSSTDYSFPNNIKFKYRLIGFNEFWKETSGKFIDYTNLSSGKYVFEVIASNSDGLYSTNIQKIYFKIDKPFWFYIIWNMIFFVGFLVTYILFYRIKQMKYLEKKAITDSTTKIFNRYKFNIEIEKKIKNNSPFTLLFLDLDHFKEINDSLGHDSGDKYICHIATTLKKYIGSNGIVARIGGDEFGLLFNNYINFKEHFLIKGLFSELRKEYLLENKIIKGSASIGVVSYPDNGVTTQQLLQHADIAMYSAKNNGRNDISFFNKSMMIDFNEKADIRYRLKTAVVSNEFELYYQPKVCKKTKKYIGLESLIRWNCKEKGMISPAVFIPESESNGTILEIGKWVIYETCKKAAYLDSKGLLIDSISLNMSPKQFVQENIHIIIKNALKLYNVDPSKIEIEITESVFASDTKKILSVMTEIKNLGVSIALDDFGSGYSSLSYLTKFPIDTLKIDRSFVSGIDKDNVNLKVLKNIFNLAKDIGMDVVVEGVETQEQLDLISKYEFKSIQGYYYSPPIKSDDVEDFLIMKNA
jgi:diguanylate cyclase (GGDEF)-like protein